MSRRTALRQSSFRPSSFRRTRTAGVAGVLLCGALVLTSCSSEGAPELTASAAFIPEPVNDVMAAGFLVLANSGGQDDTLTEVTSEIAESVEMHESVDNAMRQVESLPVPAGGTLELTRGGTHLMLHGLSRKPEPGEEVALELHFEKSEPLTLHVPVEAATYTGR